MTLLAALASYFRVRTFPLRIRDREALKAWQARKLAHWLRHDVPRVPAFHGLSPPELRDLPVMDKATLMADFSRYNRPGITNAAGWVAFDGTRRIGSFTVGASTGTSGNRGLFVISESERFAWLGAILAKAVPDFWRHRDRVAVMLPVSTPLYDSANRTRRLTLRFFDTSTPINELLPAVEAFRPSVLVAPPRILRALAEARLQIAPRLAFSAAEKLEAFDRQIIEAGFGLPLGEIYMATEGLLAVTCPKGRLHLAEDCLHFEFEAAGDGLVSPLLSDFSRKTQIMARYRLNDLLRLDEAPCPCGSPLQVVREVVGRQDDVFLLRSASARTVELAPDTLRNAILDADRGLADFRLVQTGAAAVTLHLPPARPADQRTAVRDALAAVFVRHGAVVELSVHDLHPAADPQGKLRRVRRAWIPSFER